MTNDGKCGTVLYMSEEKKFLETEEEDSKGLVVNTDEEGEQDVELLPSENSEEANDEKEN